MKTSELLLFLVSRIGQAMLVMIVISMIGFAIQNNLGDPLRELVGQSVSEAERNIVRERMGLNDHIFVQYWRFMQKAVTGDLGTSYFFKKPTLEVIFAKFAATFELVLLASVIIIFVSVPVGVRCAISPDSWISRTIMGLSIVGISIPVFLTAIFLIYIFSVQLGIMPSFGRGETVTLPWGWDTGFLTFDGWAHIIMPSVALSSIMLPLFIRLIRGEMLEVLNSEYIRFAWAKGLKPQRIWYVHALKNTLIPTVSLGGVKIGTLIAYTILTETVFQWPGMGFLFLEAVNRADTPLIIAYIIVVGFIFVTTNTIVDLIYSFINPTISIAGERK
ncbi:MAG: ABC transporter permease [Methyloligellaceae bacterium]